MKDQICPQMAIFWCTHFGAYPKELRHVLVYRHLVHKWVSTYKFVLTYFSWEMSLLLYLL